MTFPKKLSSAIMVMILILTISCSDKDADQDQEPQDCNVTSYRCLSRNESWRIVYTASGAIDSILVGNYDMTEWNEIRDFSYEEQQGTRHITVTNYYEGIPDVINKVETDPLGKILSIRDISPAIPPGVESWEQMSFAYKSDIPELVDNSTLSFDGTDDIYTSYYQWEAGNPAGLNMTRYLSDGGNYTYAYYFDRLTQPGDFLNFEKIVNTYNQYHKPFSSTNLLKAIYFDDELQLEITYTFDSDDRITGFMAEWPGDELEEWEVAYDCD